MKILVIISISLLLLVLSGCRSEDVPVVATNVASSISQTSAICGGEVISEGDSPVSEKGICWSTSDSPTIQDSIAIDTINIGSFSSELTNLDPGTEYYWRAYATNSFGTGYGQVKSFITDPASTPIMYTYPYIPVSLNSATLNGFLYSDGESEIIEYGFCWSTSENPTLSDNYVTSDLDREDYNFLRYSKAITNLNPNTTYFARSYARNAVGIGYGNEEWFTTCSESSNISLIGTWLNVKDPGCGLYFPGQSTNKVEITSDSIFYEYHNDQLNFSSPFTIEPRSNNYFRIYFSSQEALHPYYDYKFLDCNNIQLMNPLIDYQTDPCDYFKRIE